jgi:hypothetical protein
VRRNIRWEEEEEAADIYLTKSARNNKYLTSRPRILLFVSQHGGKINIDTSCLFHEREEELGD